MYYNEYLLFKNYKLISSGCWFRLFSWTSWMKLSYTFVFLLSHAHAIHVSLQLLSTIPSWKLRIGQFLENIQINSSIHKNKTLLVELHIFSMNPCLHKLTAKFLIILLHICRSTLSNVFYVCGSYDLDFH